ncbi:MAG: universal stress protein [Kiloniellales bacterium]|nr:universal stress protein [Kiloniellales bacterium]
MKRFKNILYVADPCEAVPAAFRQAIGLAERNRARLTVILVTEGLPPYLSRMAPERLRNVRTAELQAALDRLAASAAGRVEVETKVVEGKAFLEIVREVLRNGRDLVVKSADSDQGAMGWLFGSTDMHLLRKCPCPVWLIKPSELQAIRRVMACVDFDDLDSPDADAGEPLNRMILELAGSLAFVESSALHVVHASEAIGEGLLRSARAEIDDEEVDSYVDAVFRQHRLWLDRLLRKARQWIGPETYDAVKLRTHVPKGRAAEAIPTLARDLSIDLIVMGTVARSGIPGLIIGNTAESVLSQIRCSVLAVKPPDFVTPVTLED